MSVHIEPEKLYKQYKLYEQCSTRALLSRLSSLLPLPNPWVNAEGVQVRMCTGYADERKPHRRGRTSHLSQRGVGESLVPLGRALPRCTVGRRQVA